MENTNKKRRSWYSFLPNSYIIIVFLVVFIGIIANFVPSGKITNEEYTQVDNKIVYTKYNDNRWVESFDYRIRGTNTSVKSLSFRYQLEGKTIEWVEEESFDDNVARVLVFDYSVISNDLVNEVSTKNILGFFEITTSLYQGLISAANVIFIIFFSSGMIEILKETKSLENIIGSLANKFSKSKKNENEYSSKDFWIIMGATFCFGLFGAAIGLENAIPFTPLVVFFCYAMKYDLVCATAIIIGGVFVGFSSSPINQFTLIQSQGIWSSILETRFKEANGGSLEGFVPYALYTGIGLRSIFCFVSILITGLYVSIYVKRVKTNKIKGFELENDLEKDEINKQIQNYKYNRRDIINVLILVIGIIFSAAGVITTNALRNNGQDINAWGLPEMAIIQLIMAILIAINSRMMPNKFTGYFLEGAKKMAPVALIIGFARGIQIVMERSAIIDTIIWNATQPLIGISKELGAVFIMVICSVINFFIPSGSGKAAAVMPLIFPIADNLGINPEVAILAFQIGDGFSNMIMPTYGAVFAILLITKVSFGRWIRFIMPLFGLLIINGIIFLFIASWIW